MKMFGVLDLETQMEGCLVLDWENGVRQPEPHIAGQIQRKLPT
jgi:hypothetical protein